MADIIFDVVVVGYGPVSQVLALALARQGRRVAVIERWDRRYPLPRAVCIDHEGFRILGANGLADILPAISQGGAVYQWFNADWRELLSIDWTSAAISGGAFANFIHQPTLEEQLDAEIATYANVTLMLGCEARAATQGEDDASVEIVHTATGHATMVRGRYVVGCDGANSLIRQEIGGGQEDRGFEADWLVVDVRLREGVTIEQLGVPHAAQYCNPEQPTTIGPAGIRDGRLYRRWEFMRLPGVPVEELESEARVWDLLSPWATPDTVELVRHKVYTFRSLLAKTWRDRRLLIAGDAAHVMPPFMGQGLCSGLRDAWNLAWKLALVLDGTADDRLLDSYQIERFDHVSALIDASIDLGKIICMPDPVDAAARDAMFFRGDIPPLPAFPQITDGLLLREADGGLAPGAGQLAPHVTVWSAGRVGRMDEVVGAGFMLVTTQPLALDATRRDRFAAIGGKIAPFGLAAMEDLNGRIAPFLAANGWSAMLVRPDFYVFGGAVTAAEVPALIDRFFDTMAAAGLDAREAAQAAA